MPTNRRTRYIIMAGMSAIVAVAAVTAIVLYLLRDADAEDPVNEHIRIGDEASENGDYDRAVWAYAAFIDLFPNDPMGYAKRGAAHRESGDYNEAIRDFDIAIELDPEDTDHYVGRGRAHSGNDFNRRALSDFDMAIKLDGNNADAYYHRALVNGYSLYEYEAALSDLDTAISLRSDFSPALLNRGNIRLKRLEYSMAVDDFSTAISHSSEMRTAYVLRGAAYSSQQQYEQAVADYTHVIENTTDHSRLFFSIGGPSMSLFFFRGDAHYAKGDLANAIADYDRAIELHPCNVNTRLQVQTALDAYADLIDIEPDNARAHLHMGIVHTKLDARKGANHLDRAIELRPDYADAYFFRAYHLVVTGLSSGPYLSRTDGDRALADLHMAQGLGHIPWSGASMCVQQLDDFRQWWSGK